MSEITKCPASNCVGGKVFSEAWEASASICDECVGTGLHFTLDQVLGNEVPRWVIEKLDTYWWEQQCRKLISERGQLQGQRTAAVKAVRLFEAENGLMPECTECGQPQDCDEVDDACEDECVGHPCAPGCALDAARKAVPA